MSKHSLFWAKTMPGADFMDTLRPGYKPVGHHLLDVAAVAARYLAHNPARLFRESALSGLHPDQHAVLCTFLAALHDTGKISPWFQAQVRECWPLEALGTMPDFLGSIRHWEATAVLLNDRQLRDALAPRLPEFAFDHQIIAAVAGHHGMPPSGDLVAGGNIMHRRNVGAPCTDIARELCEELCGLLVPEPIVKDGTPQPEAFSFFSQRADNIGRLGWLR